MDDILFKIIIPVLVVVCGITLLLACACCRRRQVFLNKSCAQEGIGQIEKNIMTKLERDMPRRCFYEERPWDQALDDGQRPVIVFCVISSRIGVDIENAMRGVHANSRIILVLLHCHRKNLLKQRDLSDDEELLEPEMRNRNKAIAHFAFYDGEGLYDCTQNTVGHKKLLDSVRLLMNGNPLP